MLIKRNIAVINCIIAFQCYTSLCKEILVNTDLGNIRGIVQKSRKGNEYYSFRGVRYAEPPIEKNRFRPAVPIKPWNDTMDATKDGFICPQALISKSLMSEDCLNLNIYTKSLTGDLPVMFYIHGGYFAIGGCHSEIFWNPRYLMDKDIVLVVINYRLGPFGFLCLGTEDAPGNLGLKDQVLALKWVRDNIKYFGGNPKKVTISGNSAGSMSATLHMVSPMSQGLFHRVIAMSGTVTSHYLFKSEKTTRELAHSLQCPTHDSKLLVQCLRGFTWDKLLSTFREELMWFYEIEKDFGQERFLAENPTILFAKGKFSYVPVLVGITKDEYESVVLAQNNTELFDELNRDFYKAAPIDLKYDPALTHVSDSLRFAYFKNGLITNANIQSYAQLKSDAVIVHGVHRFVELVRKHTDVFYYRQDFQGRYSWDYDSNGNPYGVSHADDLLYIFVHTEKAPMFTENDPENTMVEISTTLWTTFVQTGNPNNKTNTYTSNIEWLPSNKTELKTLYINVKSVLGNAPYQNRMKLWDELFPIHKQHKSELYDNQKMKEEL